MSLHRAYLISKVKMNIEDILLKAKYLSKKRIKGKFIYKYKEGEKKGVGEKKVVNGEKKKEIEKLTASLFKQGNSPGDVWKKVVNKYRDVSKLWDIVNNVLNPLRRGTKWE